ncbi:MAG: hypothetical protein AABX34_02080 [Nanoarchaeota archaeon]
MLGFNFFKKEFMSWEDYKAKIDILEDFYWQQRVRKQMQCILNIGKVLELIYELNTN